MSKDKYTNKYIRFSESEKIFCCPICKSDLHFKEKSLICEQNHCFDISRFGYINFNFGSKTSKKYTPESFANRKEILESGYYSHILNELIYIINDIQNLKVVLDAGCGEGFYARNIAEKINPKTKSELKSEILAFDISKSAIQLAAKSDYNNCVKWFVGNMTPITLKNASVDCVLNIFSPANYSEFLRVLSDDGYIIKVVPAKNHLKELRDIAKEHLSAQDYSNEEVIEHFQNHFKIIKRKEISATYKVSDKERDNFVNMTPLLFHVEKESLNLRAIENITIQAEIIVGKKL